MKSLRQSRSAFTIIEVVLFLAITGGLFLIAFAGLQSRNEAVRFSQSVRLLESLLQQQQGYVFNGTVTQQNNLVCGGSSECIFLGRALEFQPGSNEVIIHTIAGDLYADGIGGEQSVTLFDASPYDAGSVTNETIKLDWGLEFVSGKIDGVAGSLKDVDSRIVGYVRLPNGTEILPIGFGANSGNAQSVLSEDCNYAPLVQRQDPANPCGPSFPLQSSIDEAFFAELCFTSPEGSFARLILGGHERREAITVEFDERTSCA